MYDEELRELHILLEDGIFYAWFCCFVSLNKLENTLPLFVLSKNIIESELFEDSSDDEFISDRYENNLDSFETSDIDSWW